MTRAISQSGLGRRGVAQRLVFARPEPPHRGAHDMLELGAESAAYHAGLAADIEAAKVDLVFAAGR